MDLALATHEEGEQGAEEKANPMALPPESALVLSLLQQMEDEQFEAMQLQRVMQTHQDPTAAAFFSAKKATAGKKKGIARR